jgi:hypothetical protein
MVGLEASSHLERHGERMVGLEASSHLATAEPLTCSRLPLPQQPKGSLPSAPPPTGSHARKGREGSPPGYMHPPPGPPPGYMHGEGSLRPRPESINSHPRSKGENS